MKQYLYCNAGATKSSVTQWVLIQVTRQTFHLTTCQSRLEEILAAMKTVSSDPQ